MREQEYNDENCSNVKHLRKIQKFSIQTEHLTQFLKVSLFEGCLEGQTVQHLSISVVMIHNITEEIDFLFCPHFFSSLQKNFSYIGFFCPEGIYHLPSFYKYNSFLAGIRITFPKVKFSCKAVEGHSAPWHIITNSSVRSRRIQQVGKFYCLSLEVRKKCHFRYYVKIKSLLANFWEIVLDRKCQTLFREDFSPLDNSSVDERFFSFGHVKVVKKTSS